MCESDVPFIALLASSGRRTLLTVVKKCAATTTAPPSCLRASHGQVAKKHEPFPNAPYVQEQALRGLLFTSYDALLTAAPWGQALHSSTTVQIIALFCT